MVKAALRSVLCVGAFAVVNSIVSRRIATTKSESPNLCIDGRMAPELILVGAARASSTTLSRHFTQIESVVYPNCLDEDGVGWGSCPRRRKEIHFFDLPTRIEKGRSYWLQHYPECNQGKRLIGVDLTPNYHYASGAADGIVQLYGNDLFRAKFLTLVREPLSQIQSFFYYERMDEHMSFKSWIDERLKRNDRHIQNGMYAPALKSFMAKIPPRQFIIAPMLYNAGPKDGVPVLWQGLLKQFGIEIPPNHEDVKPNSAKHPPLEDEMDEATLSALRNKIYSVTGPQKIAEVLVSPTSEDAPKLYGYLKSPQDASAIAEWIEAGW